MAAQAAAGKALVFIAVEQNGGRTGRIRLVLVADASASSLGEALLRCVKEGSKVRTDGWKGYSGLDGLGYIHAPVRKTAELGKDLLPPCHRQAGLLKRWLEGTHQGAVSPEHLDYYLDEYTFRFNRRTSRHRGKLFRRLLENAVVIEPSAYKTLVKGVRGPKSRADHKM
jgi:transposase-like protein